MGAFTSPGPVERQELLRDIGVPDFESLLKGIPENLRDKQGLRLPAGISELDAVRELTRLAGTNAPAHGWTSFLGGGVYDHFIPSAVPTLAGRSEFLTAYTPYQAEVSQGTLQAVFEYQTMICELTGMEAANASLYDGATAWAESMFMARAIRRKGSRFIIPASVNPHYRQVLQTYARGFGIELVEAPFNTATGQLDCQQLRELITPETFGVAVMSPNFFGILEDIQSVAELKEDSRFSLVVHCNPISLALLEPPGNSGADICIGEAHFLASGPAFGGPLLGFMASRKKHIRQMPGRIVGQTVDKQGRRAFVLTAQTREQHIRREKATSNICSNEGLLALSATICLSLLGKKGLADMARLNISKTQYAINRLKKAGFSPIYTGPVFNEFAIALPPDKETTFFEKAKARKILPGVRLSRFDTGRNGQVLISITEKKRKSDIDQLIDLFETL